MPSPSFDPWLNSRRFAITIDAGSSGSRLQIYSWLHPTVNDLSLPKLSVIERGSKDPSASLIKITPGISSFAKTPDEVGQHLAPLLQHARDHIPPSLHSETPLFLYATAGMRLLPQKEQLALLDAACHFLRFRSHFRVTDEDSDSEEDTIFRGDASSSPRAVTCKNHVRVITGEEEGLFGWIAVNYLLDGFTADRSSSNSTYGFLDMGGASAQMAFQVEPSSLDLPLIPVSLNLLNGESIHHDVFVTTWLGYGTNQARERYVNSISRNKDEEETTIRDPCLPRGLTLAAMEEDEGDSFSYLRGTGSFDECQSFSAKLLRNDDDNLSHYPLLPFTLPLETTPFVGVSEYWYTSEHIFGLGGTYDDVAFENAARKYCAMEWGDIRKVYGERSAELDSDSDLHSKYPHLKYQIDIHRLEMQCFKAAWIMNVLHLGLGMPRNGRKEDGSHLRPMFQSVDTIHDTAISWTLGKIVLQASKEVGRSFNKQKEPVHDISLPEPSPHLLPPPPMTDSHKTIPLTFSLSLSLSPAVVLLYALTLIVLFFISYRLGVWYRVKVCMRRWWRKEVGQGKWKKYGDDVKMEEGMEEKENKFDEEARGRLSSVRRGVLSILKIGTRQQTSEPYSLKNGYTNGHANGSVINGHANKTLYAPNSDSFETFPLDNLISNPNQNSNPNSPHSTRTVNRSASLPVPSVSTTSSGTSGRSTPQSFMFSSSPTMSNTSFSFPHPNPSPPSASASTALTTTLTNPFAQSRSRNSSQVSLVSNSLQTQQATSARSRNSSQVSLVSSGSRKALAVTMGRGT